MPDFAPRQMGGLWGRYPAREYSRFVRALWRHLNDSGYKATIFARFKGVGLSLKKMGFLAGLVITGNHELALAQTADQADSGFDPRRHRRRERGR